MTTPSPGSSRTLFVRPNTVPIRKRGTEGQGEGEKQPRHARKQRAGHSPYMDAVLAKIQELEGKAPVDIDADTQTLLKATEGCACAGR